MKSVRQNPSLYAASILALGLLFYFAAAFSASAQVTVGPNSPSTTVDDATVGTLSWSSPNNAQANDGLLATVSTGCFIAGTLIKTPAGDVPIENIRAGQEVYGFDANQNLVVATVHSTEELQVNQIVILATDAGFIVTTPDHPFYMGDNTFKLVKDVEVGTPLYDSSFTQHLLLAKIPLWVPTTPVYNLNVDGVHDFFANDLAVHNKV